MQAKAYVVFVGRVSGIYYSWHDDEKQVEGFKGAVHRSFKSREEAERVFFKFLEESSSKPSPSGLDSTPNVSSSSSSNQTIEQQLKQTIEERDCALEQRDKALEKLLEIRSKLSSLALEK